METSRTLPLDFIPLFSRAATGANWIVRDPLLVAADVAKACWQASSSLGDGRRGDKVGRAARALSFTCHSCDCAPPKGIASNAGGQ
jgi:hypothetical protein